MRVWKMSINYKSYEDVSEVDKDYILTVLQCSGYNINSITEVSLLDINGFLNMVHTCSVDNG